ncbi:hypothetical protein AGMMS4952_10280 [Spirochaetia bacterium]|nr:hypothetical protein AGMMS4952_10280 [Spirochaetia bacterium]
MGIEASKWIKTRLGGKATIVNMESSLEPSAIERASGWRDAINKEVGAANIKWVMVEATNTEDAISNTESALQANPDTQMVLVFNDLLGAGAYQAVVQSGLNLTNFFVGSCDGTNSVIDLVELPNSVFRCTIGNDRFVPEIGFYWLQTIVRAALGMSFDNPFPITTVAITADNVKEYRARQPKYVLDPEIVEYMRTH